MKNIIKNYWGLIAFALLAIVAVVFTGDAGLANSMHIQTASFGFPASIAAAAILGLRGPLFEEANGDNPNNSGGNGPSDWQGKVLDGIGKVKQQTEQIEKNFDKLDKDSKKTAEDFANHVKTFEGLPNQVADIARTVSQIQTKVAMERRSSFGSAIDRIKSNEEHRDTINGVIRLALKRQGREVAITKAQEKAGEEYFARALAGASGSGASYVNTELVPEIYSSVAEFGIWNRFDVVPVANIATKLIVDSTDPVMAWTAENTASSEASYTSANVTATIGKMLGWISVSNELLADSITDLTSHILGKFANATAYRLDFAATSANGDADTVDGGYSGIFHGGTASVAVAGNVSVATLDLEDFLNCMLAVDSSVLSKPTTAWVVHPSQLVRIISIKDLNGRSIFLPSIDAPALGAIGSILGYPVILSHAAPSTDGVSAKILTFGDLMGNAICLRSDFEFAASDQAKFTEDSTVFRARARGASKVKKATSFGVLTTAAA